MSDNLAKRILQGDLRAVAQVLTLIENGDARGRAILKAIYPNTGRAHVIGVTGAPGTGKSTLIDCTTGEFRRRKKKVGILAVDPTSPFSGGALLGDRVRMRRHFLDEGVFIRSLATRGRLGGIAAAVWDAIYLLDAIGMDIIFIETIGAGQDEVEISSLAPTVVVVLNPWSGDEIQGIKAGLLEIADLLVVNKSDLPGAEETLELVRGLFADKATVLSTSTRTGDGITPLVDAITQHQTRLRQSGNHIDRNLKISRQQLLWLLQERMLAKAASKIKQASVDRLIQQMAAREMDPYTAAEKIAKKMRT